MINCYFISIASANGFELNVIKKIFQCFNSNLHTIIHMLYHKLPL